MQDLKGTKSHIVSGMMVKKLQNKFDKVGDQLYRSFRIEQERDYKRTQRGAQMQQNIMNSLQLRNESDLAIHLVSNHVKPSTIRSYEKRKLKQMLTEESEDEAPQRKVSIFEDFNPYGDVPRQNTGSFARTRSRATVASKSSFKNERGSLVSRKKSGSLAKSGEISAA